MLHIIKTNSPRSLYKQTKSKCYFGHIMLFVFTTGYSREDHVLVKVTDNKFSQVSPFLQATKALRERRSIALFRFQTTALERGEGSTSGPSSFYPRGKTRYPLYRRLAGPQGRSGRRKISPPPRFDPRTIQPVAGRYTE